MSDMLEPAIQTMAVMVWLCTVLWQLNTMVGDMRLQQTILSLYSCHYPCEGRDCSSSYGMLRLKTNFCVVTVFATCETQLQAHNRHM